MVVKVAAIVRTTLNGKSVNKDFLHRLSDQLTKDFHTQVQHVTVEIQTDCLMVRGGSSADTAIVQLYHNDDRCNDDTKHEYAKRLAEFLCQYLRVPEDRVLVLFHDTRRCSITSKSVDM